MEIMDKARELGVLIADSDKMLNLKNAEAEVEGDIKAKTLFKEYKELQIELIKANKEKREKEIIESIKAMLMDKQNEVNEYRITKNYINAKNSFDNFMKTINDVIIYTISGEEPCSPNKCSSCGGGCK